jgi:PHD/YefM family antitoxin component YafN of YafNO toxin-antitoxin module
MDELYKWHTLGGSRAMTTLRASKTRIPPDTFSRVAYQGERIRIERRGGKPVYLVSEDDLRLLETLEDRYWAEQGRKALDDFRESGQKSIPLKKLKAELGM